MDVVWPLYQEWHNPFLKSILKTDLFLVKTMKAWIDIHRDYYKYLLLMHVLYVFVNLYKMHLNYIHAKPCFVCEIKL